MHPDASLALKPGEKKPLKESYDDQYIPTRIPLKIILRKIRVAGSYV
jgi:hypothetical protein